MWLVYAAWSYPYEGYGRPDIYGMCETLEEGKAFADECYKFPRPVHTWKPFLVENNDVLGISSESYIMDQEYVWFIEKLEPLT